MHDGSMLFPCIFPLKVMGHNIPDFPSAVLTILRNHLGQNALSCSQRPSSGNKYLSLTVTFTAESKSQLDAIYRELNSNPLVVMTL
jgi:putative lipoic acid-binding regulatory protein